MSVCGGARREERRGARGAERPRRGESSSWSQGKAREKREVAGERDLTRGRVGEASVTRVEDPGTCTFAIHALDHASSMRWKGRSIGLGARERKG